MCECNHKDIVHVYRSELDRGHCLALHCEPRCKEFKEKETK